MQYSGAIIGYDVQPVSIQANETAALNRLTITVSVTYINTLDTKLNAEFNVTRFADFDSSHGPGLGGTAVGRRDQQTTGAGYLRAHLGELVVNMERERLNRLVEAPGAVAASDLAELKALAERFPWFAGAQVLSAVGEHRSGDVLSDEYLSQAAAHIPSRSVLFDLGG